MKKLHGFNLVLLAVIVSLCSIMTTGASAADLERPLPALASGEISPLAPKVKTAEPTEAQKAEVKKTYGKLPLYFIENKGQVDGQVSFYERGAGHATFFTNNGVVLSLTKKDGKSDKPSFLKDIIGLETEKSAKATTEAVSLSFVGANKKAKITASETMPGHVNYFVGNDKSKWRSNIPTYGAVTYEDVYKNIDIKFYGNNKNIEHDVIVRSGGNPSLVKFAYDGVKGLKVNASGDLEVSLERGKFIEQKPIIYQEIKGERVAVEGAYKILKGEDGAFEYGFTVASYDKTKDLVIDPVLVYSTYLGGSGVDEGSGIAVDSSGAAYVTGFTTSSDFPLMNPIQGALNGVGDVFITKLNPTGTAIIYSTYLGRSGNEWVAGIAVNSLGAAYVTGWTDSSDFPLMNPIQGALGGGVYLFDAFITKINPTGTTIIYSTYLGGGGNEYCHGIAVDSSGAAYVTGETGSSDFPLMNPIQGTLLGYNDAFITKLSPTGTAILYSTYLGGSGDDVGYGIAVDSSGTAYVTGRTHSIDFPLMNPIQGAFGGGFTDAFVTRVNPVGSLLLYSTYLGGLDIDEAFGIAVDNAGTAYVTGRTDSIDFPLMNPIQGALSGFKGAFIAKLNLTGTAILYSTYLGGSSYDEGFGIAVDSSGAAYVAGNTTSWDFPLMNPIQGALGGGYDAFITQLNPTGTVILYSTYLGGNRFDWGNGIAVDSSGAAYVTGYTDSINFPLMNPIQGTYGGANDAFITKISGAPAPPPAVVTLAITSDAVSFARGSTLGYTVTATNTTATQQCFDYWENVTLPNGVTFPAKGALFGPVNLCLNAGASRTAHLTHGVPMAAPVGAYAFNAFVGTYPTPVIDSKSFNFDVTALGPVTNHPATSWSVIENGFSK